MHVNSWGLDSRQDPAALYLRFGAACDVVGERVREIPKHTAADVPKRHSGGDFSAMIGGFLHKEIAERPESRTAIMTGLMMRRQSAPPALFPWE